MVPGQGASQMKITDVTVQCYAWPRPRPISNGKYTYATVRLNLVRVYTDEGSTVWVGREVPDCRHP